MKHAASTVKSHSEESVSKFLRNLSTHGLKVLTKITLALFATVKLHIAKF